MALTGAHKAAPVVRGFWMTEEDSFFKVAKIWVGENICQAEGITSAIARCPSSVRWVVEVETGFLPSVETMERALGACGHAAVDRCGRRKIKFSTLRARQIYDGRYD